MDKLEALSGESGTLRAPKLGVFRCRLAVGDRVRPGVVLGTLRVLNREYRVVAPANASGIVETAPVVRDQPVGYGDILVVVSAQMGAEPAASAVDARVAASSVDGRAIVAPIAGIFYRRASPGAPPYVEVGQPVATGQTVGLIEVMKTFNPVVHAGPPGVVTATPAGDRQEVAAGEALVVVR